MPLPENTIHTPVSLSGRRRLWQSAAYSGRLNGSCRRSNTHPEATERLSSVASSLASMFAVFAEIREEKGRPIYGVREFCEDKAA